MLLSIRQPYSRLILMGKKKYELRKRPPRINCRYVLIYETSPTKAIVGFFEIDNIFVASPDKIWKITKGKAKISNLEFRRYYKNKKYGVAIKIRKTVRLRTPLVLSQIGIKHVPQDFIYVSKKEAGPLIKGLIARGL